MYAANGHAILQRWRTKNTADGPTVGASKMQRMVLATAPDMEGVTIPFYVGTLATKLYSFPGVGGVLHFWRPFRCTFHL